MQRGERLAPSARSLSNADQKLKDNSTELIVLVEQLKNGVLTWMENGLSNILEPLNEMAKSVNKWLKEHGILQGDGMQDFDALDQFLDMVKREADAAKVRGDQWHQAARADRR
jgi:ABC-type transporter Mla subunit MlaD